MIVDDRTVRVWGFGVGLAALLDALRITVRFFAMPNDAHLATGFAALFADHPILVALLTTGLCIAWLRYLSSARLAYGAFAFACLFAIVRVRIAALDTGEQDFMQSGATMAAWILGHCYARALGIDGRLGETERSETLRYAATAALAVFAATYMCAGTSKLLNSSGGWLGSETVRLMIVSHMPVGAEGAVADVRLWLVESPWATTGLEIATFIAQIGAFALLGPPALRAFWGMLLCGFHLGTWVTADIVFVAPMFLAVWFAIPWSAVATQHACVLDPGRTQRVMRHTALGVAVWLVLLWLTPVGPALRFQHQPWQAGSTEHHP